MDNCAYNGHSSIFDRLINRQHFIRQLTEICFQWTFLPMILQFGPVFSETGVKFTTLWTYCLPRVTPKYFLKILNYIYFTPWFSESITYLTGLWFQCTLYIHHEFIWPYFIYVDVQTESWKEWMNLKIARFSKGILLIFRREKYTHTHACREREWEGGSFWLNRESISYAITMHFKINLSEINIHWELIVLRIYVWNVL